MKPTHEISVACISTQPPNKEPCVPTTFPLHQGTMLFCSTAAAFEWFGWRVPWKITRYTITSSKMDSLGWWFGFLGSLDTWGSQVSQTTNPKNLSSFSGRSQIGSISPFEGKLGRTCNSLKDTSMTGQPSMHWKMSTFGLSMLYSLQFRWNPSSRIWNFYSSFINLLRRPDWCLTCNKSDLLRRPTIPQSHVHFCKERVGCKRSMLKLDQKSQWLNVL